MSTALDPLGIDIESMEFVIFWMAVGREVGEAKGRTVEIFRSGYTPLCFAVQVRFYGPEVWVHTEFTGGPTTKDKQKVKGQDVAAFASNYGSLLFNSFAQSLRERGLEAPSGLQERFAKGLLEALHEQGAVE